MHYFLASGVFDLLGRIAAAPTAADVWDIYREAARLTGLGFGIVLVTSNDRTLQDRLLASTMPEGWLKYYARQDYAAHNPLAAKTRAAARPFAWHAADWDGVATPCTRRWRDDNISAGMPCGLGVPNTGRETSHAILLGGENTDLDPRDRQTLHFAGLETMRRMQDLTAPSVLREEATNLLSARECECLKWIGAGKSDWEISQILILSEKTVNAYVERAKHKLNATTRAQAVVEAYRRKFVTF